MITRERAAEIKHLAEEKAKGGAKASARWMDNIHAVMSKEEQQDLLAHWSALPSSATIADAFDNFLSGTLGEVG